MTGLSFAGAWYIDYTYAERMQEIILPRLTAGKSAFPIDPRVDQTSRVPFPAALFAVQPTAAARLSIREQYVADYFRNADGVAVLPINGAMSRSGDLCSIGNETLMAWLDILSRDEQTRAIVLRIISPGGTVDSTKAFADKVRAVVQIKPVVAWTSFCASAAYFVASQCTEIWVEDQHVGGIGSIGVLMVLTNQSAALEKQGISVEILRADGSQDKALVNGIEPLSDQTRAEIQTMLNTCQKEFVGYVKRGRVGKISSNGVYTGKMYVPDAAIKEGLADRKGSMAQAIQRAVQLSK